ncbi:MAG: hypothetical protein IMF19_05355 [Proteobacteria bacterium]|jgi:hypothetical protein|nr:hypothetical protein [Pseudomonadota bacterium]
MGKTVIFEERYGVNVNDFSSTDEIDKVIEKKIGRKLQIINLDDHGISHSRGSVFKLRKYDIDYMFDETVKDDR